ncbi:hypothetical protein GCM10027341_07100 [Spirosoma knui]
MFTDWTQGKGRDSGQAPVGKSDKSAVLDLQLMLTDRLAADLGNSRLKRFCQAVPKLGRPTQ